MFLGSYKGLGLKFISVSGPLAEDEHVTFEPFLQIRSPLQLGACSCESTPGYTLEEQSLTREAYPMDWRDWAEVTSGLTEEVSEIGSQQKNQGLGQGFQVNLIEEI